VVPIDIEKSPIEKRKKKDAYARSATHKSWRDTHTRDFFLFLSTFFQGRERRKEQEETMKGGREIRHPVG